jgi:hypothetical protein
MEKGVKTGFKGLLFCNPKLDKKIGKKQKHGKGSFAFRAKQFQSR